MGQGGYGASQPPRRRGGLPVRLLIAVAIAGVAVWQYYSRVEVNPVTGEEQRIALSAEQEVALGLEAAPEMARQMGGIVDPDSPAARFVQEVGAKVVAGSVAAQSPYPFAFHLLADGETVNAFALPGGQVFLTAGLLTRLKDEAEVAAVLGHEVGHVIHRHGAEHRPKRRRIEFSTGRVRDGAAGTTTGRFTARMKGSPPASSTTACAASASVAGQRACASRAPSSSDTTVPSALWSDRTRVARSPPRTRMHREL